MVRFQEIHYFTIVNNLYSYNKLYVESIYLNRISASRVGNEQRTNSHQSRRSNGLMTLFPNTGTISWQT